MRLWMETYAEPPKVRSSAVMSALAHVVLIGAAVAATANAPQRVQAALAARVQYLPPPDRVTPRAGISEALHYVALPAAGAMGFDPTPGKRRPQSATVVGSPGDGERSAPVPVKTVVSGGDSVLSMLQLDSAVIRYADSASPSYPPDLLGRRIEGTVYTEYVVDTSGLADPASLIILRSTHPEFAEAVREAIPYMRFHPAKFGAQKVRQVVAQQFTFRIRLTPPDTHPDSTGRKPSGNG